MRKRKPTKRVGSSEFSLYQPQAMQAPGRVWVMDPRTTPAKGMISAISPLNLGPGFYSQLTNLRFDTQNLYGRWGCAKLNAAAISGATAQRGSWQGYMNGTQYIVGAYDNTGHVRVYSFDTTSLLQTEITTAGTRLTIGKECSFATIKAFNSTRDILVISNGTDQALVWDSVASTIISSFATPLNNANQANVSFTLPSTGTGGLSGGGWTFQGYSNNGTNGTIGGGAAWTGFTVTRSSANLDFQLQQSVQECIYAVAGQFGGAVMIWTAGSITGTPNVTWNLTTGTGPQGQDMSEIVFIVNGNNSLGLNPWNQFKVQVIDDNGTPKTYDIYDPTLGSNPPQIIVSVDPANPQTYVVVYKAQTTTGSAHTLSGVTDHIKKLVLTWEGTSFASSGTPTIEFLGIQINGGLHSSAGQSTLVPGGSSFTYSLFNSKSRDESPGWVISNVNQQPGSALFGGMTSGGGIPYTAGIGFTLPLSSALLYQVVANIPNADATRITNGVDTINIYYQAPDTFNANMLTPQALFLQAEATGSAVAGATISWTLTGFDAPNPSLYAPDAYVVTIPLGTSLYTSNGRFYVGGVNNNQLWFSDLNVYTRFESQARFIQPNNVDQNTAGYDNFPGEVVTGIAKIGGSYIGIDPVIVFTNGGVYRLDGVNSYNLLRPSRIALHGMPFGNSFTEYLGDLYWIDEERQVTVLGGGTPDQISRHKIDDKLALATLTNASLAVMNQRVHVAYQPSGASSQQNVLVYETQYNEWCEDFYPSIATEELLTIDDFSSRKIYIFDNLGNVYNMETQGQTTDAGTAIPITITTPMYHDHAWYSVKAGPIGLVADEQPVQLTMARTWKGATVVQGDGMINLASNGPTAWLWERLNFPGGTKTITPGGSGFGVQVSITGNFVGGLNIYGISMEFASDAPMVGAQLSG